MKSLKQQRFCLHPAGDEGMHTALQILAEHEISMSFCVFDVIKCWLAFALMWLLKLTFEFSDLGLLMWNEAEQEL